jgi:hypothetical protein
MGSLILAASWPRERQVEKMTAQALGNAFLEESHRMALFEGLMRAFVKADHRPGENSIGKIHVDRL